MAQDGPGESGQGLKIATGMAWVGNKLRQVEYTVIDGYAVVEGCVLLGPVEQVVADTISYNDIGTFGAGRLDPKYLWPHRLVPYVIANNLPDPHRVEAAIDHWRRNTVLNFIDRSKAENDGLYPSWVAFRPGRGCSSYVGCQNSGEQIINIGIECSVGNIIHEIGHAVGLFHEQSRNDRDQYVEVLFKNIAENSQHNFKMMLNNGIDIGEYDYGSIMHYRRDAFSRNGEDTIRPRVGSPVIGQREKLSVGDINAIQMLYKDVP